MMLIPETFTDLVGFGLAIAGLAGAVVFRAVGAKADG
jgi:hypothetical protein